MADPNANDQHKPISRLRMRRPIWLGAAALGAVWLLLGGLVIEVDESLLGSQKIEVGHSTYKVWVQGSLHSPGPWFLGVSWHIRGAPYGLTLSSDADPGTIGRIEVESIRITKASGISTELLHTGPVVVPYRGDTYEAPMMVAFDNFQHLPLPLDFNEDAHAVVTVTGRVILKDKSPETLILRCNVHRAQRKVHVMPFWVYALEMGTAG